MIETGSINQSNRAMRLTYRVRKLTRLPFEFVRLVFSVGDNDGTIYEVYMPYGTKLIFNQRIDPDVVIA